MRGQRKHSAARLNVIGPQQVVNVFVWSNATPGGGQGCTHLDNGHALLPTLLNERFFVDLLSIEVVQPAIRSDASELSSSPPARGKKPGRFYSHFFLRRLLVDLHALGEAALELVFVAAVSSPPVPIAGRGAAVLPQPPVSVSFHRPAGQGDRRGLTLRFVVLRCKSECEAGTT